MGGSDPHSGAIADARPRVALALLAAGGSRRMGRPKQLLIHRGRSLVAHAASVAAACRADLTLVVVGAAAERVVRELVGIPVEVVRNPDWEEGLSASIRAAVSHLRARADRFDALLIALADQPGVTSELLDEIVLAFDGTPGGLVACAYDGTVGPPALFGWEYWSELQALRGDRGARSVLLGYAEQVVRVPFAAAAQDVDTPDDYEALLGRTS